MRQRRRERGNARGGATKKRVFHALPDSEIYTSEYICVYIRGEESCFCRVLAFVVEL